LFNQPDSGVYAVVRGENGHYNWRSGSLLGRELPAPEALPTGSLRRHSSGKLLILDQAISWDDYAGNPIPYVLRVAVDTSGLQEQQQDFQRTLWLWLGTLGILLLIVQLLAVRWGLRPLQQIAHHIQRIEQGHAESLPDDIPVETRPLATAVNSLIAQAHARQARLRHSLADLAHSLKTPLTILRGLAPEVEDSQRARLIEEQAVRIDEIVSYQRQKAAVSGAAPLLPPVPVRPVAERLGRGLQKLNADRQVDLHLDIPDSFALKMEPGDLMELLGNLLENAFRHARREVRIAGNHGPAPTLTIDDDGNGMATDISEHLLHRGIRADQRHPGEGIGLAVVSEILSQYGAVLDIQESPLGGARFAMTFSAGK
jgi:two-component system sensor histidine kinase PhoQ